MFRLPGVNSDAFSPTEAAFDPDAELRGRHVTAVVKIASISTHRIDLESRRCISTPLLVRGRAKGHDRVFNWNYYRMSISHGSVRSESGTGKGLYPRNSLALVKA